MKPLVILSLLLIAVCGCGGPSDSSEAVDGDPAVAETEDQGFVLTLRAEEPQVRVGEEIHVTATIASQEGDAVLMGSSSGVVFFIVTRIEDGLSVGGPGGRLDCRQYVVPAEPVEISFVKSGAIMGDEPHVGFLRSYFSDPALKLPPGTWRITAVTSASIGLQCGGDQLALEASVRLSVSE